MDVRSVDKIQEVGKSEQLYKASRMFQVSQDLRRG